LPRELLADGKQHGRKLLFVCDNSNWFAKLENFESFVLLAVRRKSGTIACWLNNRKVWKF